jgi:hypothetical protein
MRLDSRQVRFITSFWPTWRTQTLRLGGRRGSLSVQEPALVMEGELLRFRLFGIEWLFRRALSEWTTVTVPYSRIVTIRRTWAWSIRAALVFGVVFTWIGAAFWLWRAPNAPVLAVTVVAVVTGLFGYIAVRIRPAVTVVYRAKTGRRIRVSFLVRRRADRQPLLEALAAHRAAATRHTAPDPA